MPDMNFDFENQFKDFDWSKMGEQGEQLKKM